MAGVLIDALARQSAIGPATIDMTQVDSLRPGARFYVARVAGRHRFRPRAHRSATG